MKEKASSYLSMHQHNPPKVKSGRTDNGGSHLKEKVMNVRDGERVGNARKLVGRNPRASTIASASARSNNLPLTSSPFAAQSNPRIYILEETILNLTEQLKAKDNHIEHL